MSEKGRFGPEALGLDAEAEVRKISERIRGLLVRFRKKGIVVGLSGGIDSSTVAALGAAALGKDKVLGLLMPEKESSPDTLRLSRMVADAFGIETVEENITPYLDALGCYRRRDEAIRKQFPEFGAGCKAKIVLHSVVDTDSIPLFSLVILTPDGRELKKRLALEPYLGILSATNFKQRVRKMLEYYHADRLNYAVAGTPNRLEYDLGFFVKLGDGAADLKPIAHLYKSQVYALAAHLGVPEEIRSRPPTTDTYSMPQSQEEFYFSLPYRLMDLCLLGRNTGVALPEIGRATGLTEEQVQRVFRDIAQKEKAAEYLHLPPQLVPDVVTVK